MFTRNVYTLFGGPLGSDRGALMRILQECSKYECRIQNYRRLTDRKTARPDQAPPLFVSTDDMFSAERTIGISPVFAYPTSATVIFSSDVLPPHSPYSDFDAQLICHIVSVHEPDAIAANDPLLSDVNAGDTIILDYISNRGIGCIASIQQGHPWYRTGPNLPHLFTAINNNGQLQQDTELKVITWPREKSASQDAHPPSGQTSAFGRTANDR